MDQSVTIDGQRVLLNGEPVAEALGDFSVRVLADAMMYVLLVQNDNNPEGRSIRQQIKKLYRLNKPGASLWCEPQQPKSVQPRRHSDAVLAERIGRNEPIRVPNNPGLFTPAQLLSVGWTRDQILQYCSPPERCEPVPRQQSGPAPADLIIKAREYYPDNEGLLRMYADCRGYSCDQVAEAIDHAKRL